MNFTTKHNSSLQNANYQNLFDMENIQYRMLTEFTNSAAGIAGIGIVDANSKLKMMWYVHKTSQNKQNLIHFYTYYFAPNCRKKTT
jgi:hypothetical protein